MARHAAAAERRPPWCRNAAMGEFLCFSTSRALAAVLNPRPVRRTLAGKIRRSQNRRRSRDP